MLLEILAGIATYLVLRRIACNRWAAFAGGAAFALNGSFAWFAHAPVNPIAFLPLLLLGIERAYSATLEGRRNGWRLIAIAGALSFYAGFPEVAYVDTLLGICWFGWRLGCLERSRWRTFVTKTGAGAAVGILLAAPLIVAGLDYLGDADLSIHANTSLGSAHFPPESLPQLFMPYIYGPIFGFTGSKLQLTGLWGAVGGYVSTSLLLLGALGLASRGRRGLRAVLSIWIVLAFARMYGQVPLLGHILGWLPGMAHIAFFRYATPALELPLVILAALGIDDVLTVPEHRRRAVWAGLAMLVIVAVGAIGARTLADDLGSHYASRPYYAVAIAWGALVVVTIAGLCLIKRVRRRGALLAAVVALDALVLFAAPELSAPRTVTVDGAPAAFLRAHLGNSRFFTLGPMQPNYGAYYGVASLNINDIPIPSRLSTYIHDRLDPYVNTTVFVGNYGGGRSLFAPSPQKELIHNIAGYRTAGVAYVLAPAGQRLRVEPVHPRRAHADDLDLSRRGRGAVLQRRRLRHAGRGTRRGDRELPAPLDVDPARDLSPRVVGDRRRQRRAGPRHRRPLSGRPGAGRHSHRQLQLRAAVHRLGRDRVRGRPARARHLPAAGGRQAALAHPPASCTALTTSRITDRNR